MVWHKGALYLPPGSTAASWNMVIGRCLRICRCNVLCGTAAAWLVRKWLEHSGKDLKGAGYSCKEVKAAGCSARNLVDAGCSAKDLSAPVTAEWLKAAGCSAKTWSMVAAA